MPTTVICVPDRWEDESELRQALVVQELLYAGLLMLDMKSGFAGKAELADRDSRTRESFGVDDRSSARRTACRRPGPAQRQSWGHTLRRRGACDQQGGDRKP